MPLTNPSNKRKSGPIPAMDLPSRRVIMADKIPNKRRQASDNTTEESDSDIGEDDNDGQKRASVASSTQSSGKSRAMNAILQ